MWVRERERKAEREFDNLSFHFKAIFEERSQYRILRLLRRFSIFGYTESASLGRIDDHRRRHRERERRHLMSSSSDIRVRMSRRHSSSSALERERGRGSEGEGGGEGEGERERSLCISVNTFTPSSKRRERESDARPLLSSANPRIFVIFLFVNRSYVEGGRRKEKREETAGERVDSLIRLSAESEKRESLPSLLRAHTLTSSLSRTLFPHSANRIVRRAGADIFSFLERYCVTLVTFDV